MLETAQKETQLARGKDFIVLGPARTLELRQHLHDLAGSRVIGLDTETAVPRDNSRRDSFTNVYNQTRSGEAAPFDPHTSEVRLLQMRGEEGVPTVIDLWALTPEQLHELRVFLRGYTGTFVIHNAKFDIKQIAGTLGVWIDEKAKIFDTMQASILLANAVGMHERGHRLIDVARDFLGVDLDKTEQASNWATPQLSEEQYEYAAADVTHLHALHALFYKTLAEDLAMPLPLQLEMDVIGPTARMEFNGVPLNPSVYKKVQEAAEYAMPALLGQIGQYFFERIQQPLSLTYIEVKDQFGKGKWVPFRLPWGGGKAGKDFLMSRANLVKDMLLELGLSDDNGDPLASTEKAVLEAYRETEPGIGMLIDYWNLVKQAQFDYLKYYHPKTKRLHPRFNASGASTGRFSCTSPNLKL